MQQIQPRESLFTSDTTYHQVFILRFQGVRRTLAQPKAPVLGGKSSPSVMGTSRNVGIDRWQFNMQIFFSPLLHRWFYYSHTNGGATVTNKLKVLKGNGLYQTKPRQIIGGQVQACE